MRDVLAGTVAGLLFWPGLAAALWPLTLRRLQAPVRQTVRELPPLQPQRG
jgi:hypothetical protein